jgi:hypothetical protein
MLSAITYRMRIPPIAVSTPDNSTYVSEETSVGSDTGSSRNSEPGPEIGTVCQPAIVDQSYTQCSILPFALWSFFTSLVSNIL